MAATTLKLSTIDAEASALLDAAARSKTTVPQSKIDDLNVRRYLVVVGGVAAVRKSLSPASWTHIRSFVNDQFRNTTQVGAREKS